MTMDMIQQQQQQQQQHNPHTQQYHQPLHSSLLSHLATEITFLKALKQRSKDQHRSQLFYNNIQEIIRLGTILSRCLYRGVSSSSSSSTSASITTSKTTINVHSESSSSSSQNLPSINVRDGSNNKKLIRVTQLFISALIKSHQAATSQIELYHFLPLQTLLLSIYSRLFTICTNVISYLDLDLSGVLSSSQGSAALSPAGSCSKKKGKKRRMAVNETEGHKEDARGGLSGDGFGSALAFRIGMGGGRIGVGEIDGIELGERVPRSKIWTSTIALPPVKSESERMSKRSKNDSMSDDPNQTSSSRLESEPSPSSSKPKLLQTPHPTMKTAALVPVIESSPAATPNPTRMTKLHKRVSSEIMEEKPVIDSSTPPSFPSLHMLDELSRTELVPGLGLVSTGGPIPIPQIAPGSTTTSSSFSSEARTEKPAVKKRKTPALPNDNYDNTIPLSSTLSNPVSPAQLHSQPQPQPQAHSQQKKKKRKKDLMDDIFGF